MPLYDYYCTHGHKTEELFKQKIEAPQWIKCECCGSNARKAFPLIARTIHSWGDSYGYYDKGLNTYINNRKERETEMEKQGKVPLEDLPRYYTEDRAEKEKKFGDYWDKKGDAMFEDFAAAKSPKEQEIAWEKHCPMDEALAGKHNKTSIEDF